ncbi:MAG: molecular chaperone DnaJ [Actinomycetota bacterium]|jgi:molecular chaperone DnaJ|nr:molecular chaperone DnaJ [Euzebyaceae bacterium]MDQ3453070.1 molecular chaperone DnaJ [Actinomycetota bacterium]
MSQRDYYEKDYYGVLGVAKGASQADVSKAYRKLARELHPDARPGDTDAETRFKQVSEAYSVLSNPEKRQEYDRVRDLVGSGGFGGLGGQSAGGFGGGGPGGFGGNGRFGGAQNINVEDLLGGLFGSGSTFGGSGQTRQAGTSARRGRDLETQLRLSFADAMAGVTTTLRVAGRAPCSVCFGTGAKPGTPVETCPTCNGVGAVSNNQGLFGFSEPCPTCGGSGRIVPQPCEHCGGSGAEIRNRDIRARIPAGVRDGVRIRLPGKGEAGSYGGPPGDLYVNVGVEGHQLFGRRGDDLTLHVPVTFSEAALGTKVRIPTLDEPVTLKVPAGTESGRTLRVKGRGGHRSGGRRGDLLVTIDVAVPRKLTRTQRKLLEDYAATEDAAVRQHLDAALDVAAQEA